MFPEHFITVWGGNPHPFSTRLTKTIDSHTTALSLGTCGKNLNKYYQFYLASSQSRAKMINKYKGDRSIWKNWPWNWKPSEWFKGSPDCKVADTLWILYVLRSTFGEGWNAPGSSIA